ncbi:MAG: hypothetical protein LBI86_03540 [Treponema sp.]|nr:hypothetical protein [Treponema sp.]
MISREKILVSLEKVLVSVENAMVSLETAMVSLEKIPVSLEKILVSLEKILVSVENAMISREKIPVSLETAAFSLAFTTAAPEFYGIQSPRRPHPPRNRRSAEIAWSFAASKLRAACKLRFDAAKLPSRRRSGASPSAVDLSPQKRYHTFAALICPRSNTSALP